MNTNHLDSTTIKVLLTDNTVYLRRNDGQEAPVFYGADGMAHMLHFEHGKISGPWRQTETGYVIEWDHGVGQVEWTLAYAQGEIAYHDRNGVRRAILSRMVRGDSEGLAGR